MAVGIVDLNADVVAVGNVETVARVDGDGMRQTELARASADPSPGLHETAVAVVVHDAGIAVAVTDKDVAVGREGHVGRRMQMGVVPTGYAWRAKRQPQRAVAGVLPDCVRSQIGEPDVALAVHFHVMRATRLAARPTEQIGARR